ncbi:MAG: TRAP transporter large permease [Sphaerochaeta sp.]|nr:TRAP transporter large permease [Sphaerochaeta sp.]MDX9915967.1 TRAP transporter large permease [Sphaerochaeta sp.]
MTTATLATIVLLGGFVVLLVLKVPVTFSLLIATLCSALINGTNLTVMVRMMIDGVSNFALLAIPFFILMGEIMSVGQVSDKIIDLANLIVGRFKGGLAYVNCIDSMFFGGISGSAVADVSSLGSVVIPLMVKQGYNREFSVGLTVVTSCQGVLIPPSHNMVIYALAAGGGISIGRMFIAGAIPGVFLGFSLLVYCIVLRNYYQFPGGIRIGMGDPVRWIKFSAPKHAKWGYRKRPQTWVVISTPLFTCEMGKCVQILINAILPMMTIVIIMGGVGLGIFTATESAAIACFYTFLLTYFVFKTAKLRDFGHVLKNTLRTLAVVLSLIATAKAFAYMMTDLRIPAKITMWLVSVTDNRVLLLLIINVLLLFLGAFMDMAPLIMIMTPILLPVVTSPAIGMNPIHFGIMLIFNLAVGLCTPPVGSALFVGCAVGKTTLEATSKKMLGMFAVMVFCLIIITYVPSFSLWLPSIVF